MQAEDRPDALSDRSDSNQTVLTCPDDLEDQPSPMDVVHEDLHVRQAAREAAESEARASVHDLVNEVWGSAKAQNVLDLLQEEDSNVPSLRRSHATYFPLINTVNRSTTSGSTHLALTAPQRYDTGCTETNLHQPQSPLHHVRSCTVTNPTSWLASVTASSSDQLRKCLDDLTNTSYRSLTQRWPQSK